MTRIREHLRNGIALALLALAIQLAAGLVHVHHDEAGEAVTAAHSEPRPDSHDRPTGHHEGEDCALCAILNLAASSILPQAPQLVLPDRVEGRFDPRQTSEHHAFKAALFKARAPPRG